MPYRPDRRLISVEEARAILHVHGEPVTRVERLALDAADQRVLASHLVATHDVPQFARAMMDGYAVHAADTTGATARAASEAAPGRDHLQRPCARSAGCRWHVCRHRDGAPMPPAPMRSS